MTKEPKRRHFNELAPRWDSLPGAPDALPRAGRFVERAVGADARRILDAGCGTGILLPHLTENCPSATCIVELDFAEEMLKENLRRVTERRICRVCVDAQALPFFPGSFDHVLCFGVLPHLVELPQALQELFRVLGPAGTFSVGHLMGSAELNAFHRSLGGPLASDTLPAAESLAQMFCQLGARVNCVEERPDWYFVQARKALA